VSLKIKSDTKFLLNKIVSQFSKSGYDERWANLEITVRDNKLYLIGGGLGMIVVIKVDTEGTASDFAGQVDLRRFFETIKFMGKDTEITFGNNLTVEKKGRKVVFSVQERSFDNMLPLPVDKMIGNKDGVLLEVYPECIKNLIEFISDDTLRPSLTGIYMSTVNGRTSYVATDAFHLLEIYTKMEEVKPFLINPSVPFAFDEDVYVQRIGNHIIYSADSWIVYQSILNNNEYPDYRRVLNALYGNWKTFSVNRKDMMFALKSAMGFAGGKLSAAITFKIDGDILNMTSQNKFNVEPDIYTDKIKIKNMDNVDIEVAFFTKYFLDGIIASSEEEVLLNVAKNDHIFISESDRRMLLLPIKKE